MIFDCFLFFNEFDMLRLRLKELEDVVDVFVLVESSHTFSGQSKPLYFEHSAHDFKDYNIVHIKTDDLNDSNPWANEAFQRNSPMQYLKSAATPTDIVLLCDLDEIPNPKVVSAFKDGELSAPAMLQMDFYYYNFDWIKKSRWCRSSVVHADLLNQHSIEGIRNGQANIHNTIANAGWHSSYFMSPEQIQDKIKSFSHQEYNRDKYLNVEGIRQAILSGRDLFRRGRKENLVRTSDQVLPENVRCLPPEFWPTRLRCPPPHTPPSWWRWWQR